MVDGQVSYHRPQNVRRTNVEKNNSIVRQIEKTKVWRDDIDLYQSQQDRLREIQLLKKERFKAEAKEKKRKELERKRQEEARSYDRYMQEGNMKSNAEVESSVDASAAEAYEEDFF